MTLTPEGRLLLLVNRLAPRLVNAGFARFTRRVFRDVVIVSPQPRPAPRLPRPHLGSKMGRIPRIGRLAQLVERLLYTQDVGGSSPSSPILKSFVAGNLGRRSTITNRSLSGYKSGDRFVRSVVRPFTNTHTIRANLDSRLSSGTSLEQPAPILAVGPGRPPLLEARLGHRFGDRGIRDINSERLLPLKAVMGRPTHLWAARPAILSTDARIAGGRRGRSAWGRSLTRSRATRPTSSTS